MLGQRAGKGSVVGEWGNTFIEEGNGAWDGGDYGWESGKGENIYYVNKNITPKELIWLTDSSPSLRETTGRIQVKN